MKMEVQLRVLTLNCWGIPGISADRKARMNAIAQELATGTYDLVVLQEVWSYPDYEMIARKSFSVLPYSHYFRSGMIGAGLCVFSKGRITDTLFQAWPLNGYAHRIQHGDWFGGKGVGMTRIQYLGLHISLYTAHLHAVYNHTCDEYLAHRVCQAFDFSQFVAATSSNNDLVIVAGDFNAEPEDIPYRLLRHNSNLLDAFTECKNDESTTGATNETAHNTYTPKSVLKQRSEGRRIDYILYNCQSGTEVKTVSCGLALDKVPGHEFSYSDHEAVVAQLQVTKTQSAKVMEQSLIERLAVLEETKQIVQRHIQRLNWDRLIYLLVSGVLFCLLFGTIGLQVPYGLQGLLGVFRIFFSIIMTFCILMGTVWNRIENNSLMAVDQSIGIILNYLGDEKPTFLGGDASRPQTEIIF